MNLTLVQQPHGQLDVIVDVNGALVRFQIKNPKRSLALLCAVADITWKELEEQLKSEGIFSAPEEPHPKNSPGAGAPERDQKEEGR